MIRSLHAVLLTGALLLGACGPSAEDKAEKREAAAAKATEAARRALGEDLQGVAKAMTTKLDAKGRMDPKVATAELERRGYRGGTSLMVRAPKSQNFCIWAASPKTKRTYVYQSLTDDAKVTAQPVDWCVADEYPSPAPLTTAELKRESAVGAERGLKLERDEKALRQDLQRLADSIEKDWQVTPNFGKPTNASEKRLAADKSAYVGKAMNGFEPQKDSILLGGAFGASHFCLVMYYDGGIAAVYQYLDKKITRVKSGSTACNPGTVQRP